MGIHDYLMGVRVGEASHPGPRNTTICGNPGMTAKSRGREYYRNICEPCYRAKRNFGVSIGAPEVDSAAASPRTNRRRCKVFKDCLLKTPAACIVSVLSSHDVIKHIGEELVKKAELEKTISQKIKSRLKILPHRGAEVIRTELVSLLPKSHPKLTAQEFGVDIRTITQNEKKRSTYVRREKISDDEIREVLYWCCRPDAGKSNFESNKCKQTRKSTEKFHGGTFWNDMSFSDLDCLVKKICMGKYSAELCAERKKNNTHMIGFSESRIRDVRVKCCPNIKLTPDNDYHQHPRDFPVKRNFKTLVLALVRKCKEECNSRRCIIKKHALHRGSHPWVFLKTLMCQEKAKKTQAGWIPDVGCCLMKCRGCKHKLKTPLKYTFCHGVKGNKGNFDFLGYERVKKNGKRKGIDGKEFIWNAVETVITPLSWDVFQQKWENSISGYIKNQHTRAWQRQMVKEIRCSMSNGNTYSQFLLSFSDYGMAIPIE